MSNFLKYTILTLLFVNGYFLSDSILELKSLTKINLVYFDELLSVGSLAPLPGPTVEGTSTAGWTDDGSIVRLNTQSDNVGIGTLNPTAKLQVQGSVIINGDLDIGGGTINLAGGDATTTITILPGGNVGIGTTTPTEFFSVQGSTFFTGTSTVGNLVATGTTKFGGFVYRWPSVQGTANQILQTDGARQNRQD